MLQLPANTSTINNLHRRQQLLRSAAKLPTKSQNMQIIYTFFAGKKVVVQMHISAYCRAKSCSSHTVDAYSQTQITTEHRSYIEKIPVR